MGLGLELRPGWLQVIFICNLRSEAVIPSHNAAMCQEGVYN